MKPPIIVMRARKSWTISQFMKHGPSHTVHTRCYNHQHKLWHTFDKFVDKFNVILRGRVLILLTVWIIYVNHIIPLSVSLWNTPSFVIHFKTSWKITKKVQVNRWKSRVTQIHTWFSAFTQYNFVWIVQFLIQQETC